MLIQESFKDVPTQDGGSMRIFTFHPQIPNYPKAKFPGVVVFSEIYQGECDIEGLKKITICPRCR